MNWLATTCVLAWFYGLFRPQLDRTGARVGWWFYRRAMARHTRPPAGRISYRYVPMTCTCHRPQDCTGLHPVYRRDPIGAVIEGMLADQQNLSLSPAERKVREQMRRNWIPVYRERP